MTKSLDVSKAIDKAKGAEREIVGKRTYAGGHVQNSSEDKLAPPIGTFVRTQDRRDETAPTTDLAKRYAGYGTSLKPAFEPIVVARKPLIGTVAANVERWGTGALNIDGTRVAFKNDADLAESTEKNRHADFGTEPGGNTIYGDYTMVPRKNYRPGPANPTLARHARGFSDRAKKALGTVVASESATGFSGEVKPVGDPTLGRWPANVILSHSEDCVEAGTKRVRGNPVLSGEPKQYDGGVFAGGLSGHIKYTDDDGMETVAAWECSPECPVRLLDEQSGELTTHSGKAPGSIASAASIYGTSMAGGYDNLPGDTGGASRFFAQFGGQRLPIEEGTTRFRYTAKADKQDRAPAMTKDERRRISELRAKGEPIPLGLQAKIPIHPTVKPVNLLRWLITLVTPPHTTDYVPIVLDCFAGSGSTGQAALALGYRCILIEKEAEYVRGIREWRGAMQIGLGL